MSTAKQFPIASYLRESEQPFQASATLFQLDQLAPFYCVPGEFGHLLEGRHYGFAALTLIITETYPGGGPPMLCMSAKRRMYCWTERCATSWVTNGLRRLHRMW